MTMLEARKRPIKRKPKKGNANAIPERSKCQYNVNDAKTAPKKLMMSAPQAPTDIPLIAP
ncbi:hypothetical protein AA0473_1847 [Acetobacter orleanensis NRIC 0473]|nr:hypothetical protein AA0473_1847 [Acetobacter orleanensis NRIC 0473]